MYGTDVQFVQFVGTILIMFFVVGLVCETIFERGRC